MKNRIKDEFLASGVNSQKVRQLSPEECGKICLESARKLYEQAMKDAIVSQYTFPSHASSDGYYHVYVSDPSKKNGRRAVKAKTLEELKEKVYRHEKGENGTARKTFHEAFEALMDRKLSRVKDPEKKVSRANTVGKLRSDYKRYFVDTSFEKMYVDEISRKDIDRIICFNLEKYDLREKAASGLCSIIKQIMELAASKEWIERNPYPKVDYEEYRDMLLPPVPIIDRAHTDEELMKMRKFIREKQQRYPKYLAPYAFELQMIIGSRRGEIPPLAWSDIRNNMLLIYKEQLTKKSNGTGEKESFVIVRHTKTGQDRSFPITEELSDFLERLRNVHRRYYPGSEYLFPADTPNGVITNNVVYNFYRRMCRSLHIPVSRDAIKGTHSLRRNAITDVLSASNGDIETTAQLFGNSPQVIRKYYNLGADDGYKRSIIEKSSVLRKARTADR